MLIEHDEEMENPYSRLSMVGSIIFSSVWIIASLLLIDKGTLGVLLFIFFIYVSIHVLLNDFYVDIYHRPVSVAVNEYGLFLRFRWSEPRQIEWDEIEFVHVPKAYDDGSFRVKGEKYLYHIKTFIGEDIRRRHYLAKGHFPFTSDEYRKSKRPTSRKH